MIGLEREGPPAIGGKRAAMPFRILAAPRNSWDVARDRTTRRQGDSGQDKPSGRKASGGRKKQLLTSTDPEIIRRIKSAAALKDTTASLVMEEAAAEWLERHQDGKK